MGIIYYSFASSTPLQETESSKTHTEATSAIKNLITGYASKYDWQIWLDGAPRDVKCKDAESLSYLSNLFYGMRCIFSHGNPQKTLDFGAMRVDRTPQKSSDFNISIPRVKGRTEEECIDTKKRCEDYLFSVLKKARGESSQMTMDYDLFLTAQSFYACAVKIIGSVAACVACKYSDAKLSEKADKEIMKEIKQANKAAWEEIATAASPMSQTIPTMDVTSDDISGLEPEQTTASVAPSTGLTADFEKVSFPFPPNLHANTEETESTENN